jgi:hypothetical protein
MLNTTFSSFKIPIFEYSTTLPELSRQSVVALEEVKKTRLIIS